jgi:hypothetical protein
MGSPFEDECLQPDRRDLRGQLRARHRHQAGRLLRYNN